MALNKRTLLLIVSLVLAVSMSVFGTVAYLTSSKMATNTFTVGDVQIDLDETDVDEDGNPRYPIDEDGDGEPDREIIVDEDGTITIIDPTIPDDPETPEDESIIDVIEPEGTDENGNPIYPDDTDVDGDGDPDKIIIDEDGNIVLDPDDPDEEEVIEPGKDNENEYNLVPGEDYLKDPTVTIKAGSEEAYVRMRVAITEAEDAEEFFNTLVKDLDEEHWGYKGLNADGELEFWYMEDGEFVAVEASKTVDTELPPLFTTIEVPGETTSEELKEYAGVKMNVYGDAIQSASFDSAEEAWEAFEGQN